MTPIRLTTPRPRMLAPAATVRAGQYVTSSAMSLASAGRGISARSKRTAVRTRPNQFLVSTRRRICCRVFCSVGVFALHVGQHGEGRPAIELEAVRFLIGAEREPRAHAGLAVDFVHVEPEC